MENRSTSWSNTVEIGPRGIKIADALLSLAFLVMAVVFFVVSVTTLRMTTPYGPGPGLIPSWASLCFAVLSAALLVSVLRRPLARFDTTRFNVGSAVVFVGLIVLTALGIPFLGLLPAVGLFFVVTAMLLEGCPPLKAALVGIGVIVVLHVMLVTLLRLPLPMGIFAGLGLGL